MKLRREWIYQIKERLRATNPDMLLSNRMVNNQLETTLGLLIRRDSDSRLIWKQTNLFTTVTVQFRTTGDRSKSTVPLPPIYQSRNNPFLQLFGVDGTPFTLSSPLRLAGQTGYYGWLENDFLILAQPDIEELSVRYWAKPHKDSICQSELDVLFTVPDHLKKDLEDTAVQALVIAPLQIPEDTYPNENTNQKSGPRSGDSQFSSPQQSQRG